MNKKKIDEYIPIAYEALKASTLTTKDNKKMEKTYRGYVSSFGAAIIMGSVRAAVAYNMKDDTRNELMDVIFKVLGGSEALGCETLFDYVNQADEKEAEENIYNAAIAVKLAMNQFELVKDGGENDGK